MLKLDFTNRLPDDRKYRPLMLAALKASGCFGENSHWTTLNIVDAAKAKKCGCIATTKKQPLTSLLSTRTGNIIFRELLIHDQASALVGLDRQMIPPQKQHALELDHHMCLNPGSEKQHSCLRSVCQYLCPAWENLRLLVQKLKVLREVVAGVEHVLQIEGRSG